jgi:hypothetical protein
MRHHDTEVESMLIATRKGSESTAVDGSSGLEHLLEKSVRRNDAGSSIWGPWAIQASPLIAVHGVPQAIATSETHASPCPSPDHAWARLHTDTVDIRDSGSLFLGHLPSLRVPPLSVALFYLVAFASAELSEAEASLDHPVSEARARSIVVS